MLHYLALRQFQCSCPILYILFGNLQSDGHNTNFIPLLFQSSKLSNSCIFRISLSFYSIYCRKIIIYRKLEVQIVIFLSSENSYSLDFQNQSLW